MGFSEVYRLSEYQDYGALAEKEDIHLLRHKASGEICVKKILDRSLRNIIEFRKKNTAAYFPRIIDSLEGTEGFIIIEEYIAGITLEEYMMGEKLPQEQAVRFAYQVCKALQCLHSASPMIIYRDLKPENIMITPDLQVKLTDFHISRQYQDGKRRDTKLLGTAEYAAPEQFGYFQTDNRTDIYAFGVLFNYMLTGKFPVEHITEGKYASVVRKCMELEPDKRYQSIEEILQILDVEDEKEKSENVKGNETSWRIPGFRSGRIWKMILAVLGYAFLFYAGLTMEFTKDGVPYPIIHQWINRLLFLGAQLATIFFCADYRGIAKSVPVFKHRFAIVRIGSYMITWVVFFILAVVVSAFLEIIIPL